MIKKIILIIFLIVWQFNAFAQTKFYSNSVVLAGSLFNRKCPDGKCQLYLIENNNDTFLIDEGEVFNKKRQGFWITYHKNIKSAETYYLNGEIEGIKRYFYTSGKVERMEIYHRSALIESIEYYENGNIKSESNYLVDRSYYSNGQLKSEKLHKKDSSNLFFNYCICYKGENLQNGFANGLLLNLVLNENNEPYVGNEWYENGKKKVSTKLVNRKPYIMEVIQYDSLERPTIIGKMQHVKLTDENYNCECFEPLGTWVYYNAKGEIEKVITHKSYH